ncbi:MAG: COX15/CtaA family protein [Bdellovibrionales bacterium]|nr:COX15/CtaA family protein [Bdellovibrionales bacterium]
MKKYFHIFCLITLFLALFVILWGAWVRFSHSGDGCGMNWPLCHDEWIPESSGKTWIEWFHRASSSVFGLFVLALTVFGFKYFPKNHKVRFWSLMTLVFTISEALIGALLVLKGLTGQNTSVLRLFILNAHLLNSLFLVGSLVFCLRSSIEAFPIPFKKVGSLALMYIVIALTGSVASLSNTLFPSSSLTEGWLMDFDENAPWIVPFRLWHPVVAVLIGGGVLLYLFWSFKGFVSMKKNLEKSSLQRSSSLRKQGSSLSINSPFLLMCFLCIGLLTGAVTLFTLSPVVMKLIHLFAAYSIWVVILLYR